MVNVTLMSEEYNIDSKELTNLFHFVRANKSNRFGAQWYDFLEECSSSSGREYMDLSLYLVQLESMLYFLLNEGEKSRKGCCVDKFVNEFCKPLSFMSDKPNDYMEGGKPVIVNEQSSLPKVLIGVKIAKEASMQDGDVAKFISSCEGKLQSNNKFLKDLKALNDSGFYNVCNREGKGKENFAILIDVLIYLYGIKVNDKIDSAKLIESRNKAVHDGELNLDEYGKRMIVRTILWLAVKISPKAEIPDASFRVSHLLMEKIDALFSGFSLERISECEMVLKALVLLACRQKIICWFVLVLLVVFGYFIYKDNTVYINFDNVPQVKRVELYDRIITGNATEEYVLRLQKEVKSSNQNKMKK